MRTWRYLHFAIVAIVCSCVGCFFENVDGGGDALLVNGYFVFKTSKDVCRIAKRISDDKDAVIPPNVLSVRISGDIVSAVRRDRTAAGDSSNEYWILNTKRNTVEGPLSLDAYDKAMELLGIGEENEFVPVRIILKQRK